MLVLNVGSSSVKFALFPLAGELSPRWRGRIAPLGLAETALTTSRPGEPSPAPTSLGKLDHEGALHEVIARAAEMLTNSGLAAVGHRVVHGGPDLAGPVLLDHETLGRLHAMDRYDPAHQAIELHYIESVARRWPDLPQVASFDTTFHRTMPEVAQRLPVTRLDATRGVRRYGFHGLSYAHVGSELRRVGGDALADGRVIVAHLGSGASLAALRNGRSVETTMGFSPSGGLPMSTRSGDLDPGVFLWLARHGARSVEELFAATTRESGLLAVSGTTSDVRDLLEREDHDPRAADAVDYFCYHIRKAIGALAAVLGGVDTLVFTGGIGEHQPPIRQRVCTGLSFLGIELDDGRNAANAPVISRDRAPVGVRIIPADEERMIAQAVREVLQERAAIP